MLEVVAFELGLVIGSFLNVCFARIPHEESVIRPPSRCPKCKTPIAFYDNIPLISYVLLRGRCRSCSETISPRYFIVELLMGLFAVALYYRFGLSYEFFVGFVFVAAMIVISVIDLDERIVPDVISLPGIVLGIVFSAAGYFLVRGGAEIVPPPLSSGIGILAGGGFLLGTAWLYEKFTGVEGMGGGDIDVTAVARRIAE